MANILKKIDIKLDGDINYISHEIGVDAKNVDIQYNSNNEIITDGSSATTTKSLADFLKTKETIKADVLLGKNWNSDNTYSFESTYANKFYNLEIEPDSLCSLEQKNAYDRARIIGSSTSNIIKAYGTKPTIDIPIIIKVVAK